MPRLLRLAKCQGYASSAIGCGGRLCACRHNSPFGGSTLITSAPKSDRITAALGPAIKLARSTTFSPEKILSSGIAVSLWRRRSAPVKLRRTLFEEGFGAFRLVLGSGTESEIGRLEHQTLAL